jgi:hypothetical protein
VKADDALTAMGASCFLFRDAAGNADDRLRPIPKNSLEAFWYKVLEELERSCDAQGERDLAGAKLVFVNPDSARTTHYPLHSLRVSLITAYALDGGVPMQILSKCIAGHARLVMTLYYTKAGITYVSEKMEDAEKRILENEQQNYVRWLKDATYKELEANGAYFNPAAIQAVMEARSNGASLVRDDKGYCPKGGFGCDSGGVYVNEEAGSVSYGEVPGYPEKNCVRCRWFFTGPAFLDGLQNHWNGISLRIGDIGERVATLEGEIEALEDERYDAEVVDQPFTNQTQLNSLRKIWQAEVEKNNKLGNDLNATTRLMIRCRTIANGADAGDGVLLVAAGSLSDVQIAVEECGKLQQVLTAVAGSAVFAEHDVSKAILQAGRAYDLMLAMNDKSPICFRLSEEELRPVVQHITRMLQAEAGSIKGALPFIEGQRRLTDLGLDLAIDDLAHDINAGSFLQVTQRTAGNLPIRVQQLLSGSGSSREEAASAV